MGLAHNDSEGIFRNLVVQALGSIFGSHHGTVVLAEGYALSATYAFGVVYFCLAAGIEVHSVVCAMLHADVAADAACFINLGLRGAMQFQLSAYAGTSHAQILQGAAKPACSCPLKWFILITISASAIAVPILGAGQYSPFRGISR